MTVRRLGPDDAAALHALRREALETHPLAFGASPADDRMRSLEGAAATLAPAGDHAVYGAFEDGRLVGMGGIRRDDRLKSRHMAVIWGMFVAPGGRRRGAGRALLEALLAHARGWPGVVKVEISVTEAAPEAARLYAAAGFRAWGREPRSLCWEGRCVDQIFMNLDLDGAES
jgi:RimJ/RimL family protein N-acetyltransferase